MKKFLFAFMALATAFAAVSCQSDEEHTLQLMGKPMVINAVAEGIGTGVRATMAYKYDILWSAQDQIYVTNNTNHATFTLIAGQETTKGTFACQSSPFTSGDEVEAYYPATLVDNGNLVWPAEQTTNTVVPMYSKHTLGDTGTENFSFASLGAMLQIVFTTPQADVTLKSITIKDDNATLSGAFSVDESGKASITATDKAGITLDLGEGVAVSNKIQYFNIAVPAGTYSNLTITFTATDDCTCTMKGNVTIHHNTVGRLTLTGKEFFPFGQGEAEVNASAGIPDNKVKWVQLWKDGPKFAEYNVGATSAAGCGGYYAWGGSQDRVNDHNDGTEALSGDNDTATKLWGENWRMPTKEELQGLLDNCDVEWTNVNGLNGRKFTGKDDYANNSVFLPAVGYCSSGSVKDSGTFGYYWSSIPYGSNYAYELKFRPISQSVNYYNRNNGLSVRAVLK